MSGKNTGKLVFLLKRGYEDATSPGVAPQGAFPELLLIS